MNAPAQRGGGGGGGGLSCQRGECFKVWHIHRHVQPDVCSLKTCWVGGGGGRGGDDNIDFDLEKTKKVSD